MPWTLQQVAKHNSPRSCWIIINSKVYDVTDFLSGHPGGAQVILKYAGQDATAVYEPIHSPDTLEKNIPCSKHMGDLDADQARALQAEREGRGMTKDEERMARAEKEKPPLNRILSLKDMEDVARKILSLKALAYYSSAADDEVTTIENARAFSRFFFHPRVLRPATTCDPSTTILGYKSSIPIFISGAALAKLGHPLGEVNLTLAAAETHIPQMVSSNASLSPSTIMASATPSQPLFYQLYKHRDNNVAAQRVRDVAAQRVRDVEKLGYKAIWLTVDAIVAGNRERDIRSPWEAAKLESKAARTEGAAERPLSEAEVVDLGGTAGALLKNDDLDMSWSETIPWLRSVTKLPIVIKGIQCVEDAVLAAGAGVDGILLSNHGGRQLEYSLPPIEVLYRLRRERPDVFDKMEVYIDGGISRGTDILKALCLGATAVGLGRPFLYAQSAYGAAGAVKIVSILTREIKNGMRLLGVTNVREMKAEMVERVDWQPLLAKL